MIVTRILAGFAAAALIVSACTAVWLTMHAPRCKMVPARGYYAVQDRCGR